MGLDVCIDQWTLASKMDTNRRGTEQRLIATLSQVRQVARSVKALRSWTPLLYVTTDVHPPLS